MKTKVVVHTAGDYERYLSEAFEKQNNLSGAELGKSVYEKKGCKGCHSLDGSTVTGPSFKGTFGTDIKLDNGKAAKFDAAYVRNALLNPGAEARAGVANKGAMPTITISDKEIEGVIEFLKAQK
jgi:cytochrome c oxidase subunit 2